MSKKPRKAKPYKPKHIHIAPPTRKVEASTPWEAVEQFAFEAASSMIDKVGIVESLQEMAPQSAEIHEVLLNFQVAALALLESVNIMNGDIPPRILQKYGVETNEPVSNHQSS